MLAVETLNVEEPEPPLTEVGVKLPLAPAGKPETLKATSLLNPFCGVTVMAYVVLPLAVTLRDVGDGESVKLGTGTVQPLLL